MKTTDIEYSIILPCLNEEKTLGICIRKIHQFFSNTGLTYEIIVADNGSTDNSALVAKNNRADVIQVSQKGYGSALRHGIEHCNGKYIIMGDADDSYNFLELSLFIERLQAGYSLSRWSETQTTFAFMARWVQAHGVALQSLSTEELK